MLSFLKPKEPELDSREVWMSYSRALQEQQYDYEQELASARARLSAAGVAEGSEKWEQGLSAVEKRRQDLSARMQNTKAHNILQRRFEQAQAFASHREYNPWFYEEAQEGLGGGIMAGVSRRAEGRMKRAERFARQRYDAENPNQPRRDDFDTAEEFMDARRAMPKFEVTMQDYFESQYGQADITGYQGRAQAQAAGGPTPEQQAATQRARRGAAGGTSPWW